MKRILALIVALAIVQCVKANAEEPPKESPAIGDVLILDFEDAIVVLQVVNVIPKAALEAPKAEPKKEAPKKEESKKEKQKKFEEGKKKGEVAWTTKTQNQTLN